MILVDSNVLIDHFSNDPTWADWSRDALRDATAAGQIAINQIVYSEVSVDFTRIEHLDEALEVSFCRRLDLPWQAGFLAGKAFAQYRRRGGKRRSPLPDFYIGAHAAVARMPLLTRDPQRYRAYFPKLKLISPE